MLYFKSVHVLLSKLKVQKQVRDIYFVFKLNDYFQILQLYETVDVC